MTDRRWVLGILCVVVGSLGQWPSGIEFYQGALFGFGLAVVFDKGIRWICGEE